MTEKQIEKELERAALLLEAIEAIDDIAESTVRRLAVEAREAVERVNEALGNVDLVPLPRPEQGDRTPSERLRALLAEMSPIQRAHFRVELYEAMHDIDMEREHAAGANGEVRQ
jgi:hypothetical protein